MPEGQELLRPLQDLSQREVVRAEGMYEAGQKMHQRRAQDSRDLEVVMKKTLMT